MKHEKIKFKYVALEKGNANYFSDLDWSFN